MLTIKCIVLLCAVLFSFKAVQDIVALHGSVARDADRPGLKWNARQDVCVSAVLWAGLYYFHNMPS